MSERSAAEEAADGPEPTQSESRLKRPDSADTRPARVSVRPSAFGPPRPSSAPPSAYAPDARPGRTGDDSQEEPLATSSASPTEAARSPSEELPAPLAARGAARARDAAPDSDTLDSSPSAQKSRPAARSEAPSSATTQRLPGAAADTRGAARAQDTVERDPVSNSQFATRLSLLNTLPPQSQDNKAGERARRPWRSIALFVGMLALSAVPLLRYLKLAEEPGSSTRRSSERANDPRDQEQGPQAALGPTRDPHAPASEAAAAEQEQQALMALVAEANRALDGGDAPQAERLFGRVIALDEDNPRAAFGLSRIRLAQGNLSGAEGWIQLAIRKRPRRAAYHLHYAQILERLGNMDEARAERRRALGGSEAEE